MNRIYSRASWGARYRDGVGNRPVGSLQKYLHHSVTRHLSASASIAAERAECRTVELIGQQRFGRGISYTFLIFPSGRIYQGASVHRISYHSGGGNDGKPRNTLGVGICLVGNTHANKVTSQQQAALVWLLQEGVRQGWWNDPAITEGHRDFKATTCPGDHAYRLIGTINRRARGGSYADFKRNGLPGSSPAPTPERTWLDMATADDVRKIVREEIERSWKVRPPSGHAEGTRQHTFRYHDRDSQLLYGADAGLHAPGTRARVVAIEQALAGRKLDEGAIAAEMAKLLLPDLGDMIAEAIAAQPDRSAAEVARVVVDELGTRINAETASEDA